MKTASNVSVIVAVCAGLAVSGLMAAVFAMSTMAEAGTRIMLVAGAALALHVAAFALIARTGRLAGRGPTRDKTDPVTGIATRDTLFDHMQARPDEPGVFLIIDIDRFRDINARHGLKTGDAVLRQTAMRLQDMVREGDILCRYGANEFLLFLTNRRAGDVAGIAERLRCAVETQAQAGSHDLPAVTVSIGVSSFSRLDRIDTAMQEADTALAQAKVRGGNRVLAHAQLSGQPKARPRLHIVTQATG